MAQENKGITKLKVIKQYFDMSPKEALTELKALNDDERLDLAQGAARNIGLTQDQCAFPLNNEATKQE